MLWLFDWIGYIFGVSAAQINEAMVMASTNRFNTNETERRMKQKQKKTVSCNNKMISFIEQLRI